MPKERAHLDLSEDLDLSDFAPVKKEKQRDIDLKVLEKVAEESGFVSRKNKNQRRRKPQSPYTNQLNVKCRVGIKELFQDIGAELAIHDHTAFEEALVALMEKYKFEELLDRYNEIITKK